MEHTERAGTELVADYLRQLEQEAGRLPWNTRQELLEDVRSHIEVALDESGVGQEPGRTEVLEILGALGEPGEIVAAAMAAEPWPATPPTHGRGPAGGAVPSPSYGQGPFAGGIAQPVRSSSWVRTLVIGIASLFALLLIVMGVGLVAVTGAGGKSSPVPAPASQEVVMPTPSPNPSSP